MDGLKGFAEVAEHILYEVLGLLIPGGAFALAVSAALGGEAWTTLLVFGRQHPWLSLAGAYVLGYPVQGISRPVTVTSEWLLRFPGRLVIGTILRLVPQRPRRWAKGRLMAFERWLTGRHGHEPGATREDAVDLEELSLAYWTARLLVPAGKSLSPRQVQDLSFSVLLPERKQLDRFRAATSLARGVAVSVVAVALILAVQLWLGVREPSWSLVLTLMALVVAFYGLMQRAEMYDELWRDVVPAQLLCAVTRDGRQLGIGASTYAIDETVPPYGVTGEVAKSETPPTPMPGRVTSPMSGSTS